MPRRPKNPPAQNRPPDRTDTPKRKRRREAPLLADLRPPAQQQQQQGWDTRRMVPLFRCDRNRWQVEAWELLGKRNVVFLTGPAGTAKTHIAVARGLHELIVAQSVKGLVLSRPAVEAGERLGFMPGDQTAKLDPYMRPIYDILTRLLGTGPLREQVGAACEVAAVAFLRGRTFNDAFVLIDEAQNCTWSQLHMATTRVGEGSTLVVTGDPDQCDLPNPGPNPLARLLDSLRRKKLDSGPVVGVYQFPEEAVVRSEACRVMLQAFTED